MTEGGVISPELETGPQIRILVVDDGLPIRKMVKAMVQFVVKEVDIAGNPEEALAMLEEGRGKYNALLTDNNMGPTGNEGLELARRAKERFPDLVCALMTGAGILPDKTTLERNGIGFVLEKPFRMQAITDLISGMKEVISQQSNQ